MSLKVGELVVDWDALEVGDQAIFEGFAGQSRNKWSFTVGNVYVVGVDEFGDKGFIGGDGTSPESHYADDFKFRLTHKVSDTIGDEVKQPFPKSPFKIRNGDKPEVRQWLKDNGVVWYSGGCIVGDNKKHSLIFVHDYVATHSSLSESYFNLQPEQEISINIQPAVITGWEIVENISEKDLQLKEKIAKLTTELEEAQEELNNL